SAMLIAMCEEKRDRCAVHVTCACARWPRAKGPSRVEDQPPRRGLPLHREDVLEAVAREERLEEATHRAQQRHPVKALLGLVTVRVIGGENAGRVAHAVKHGATLLRGGASVPPCAALAHAEDVANESGCWCLHGARAA